MPEHVMPAPKTDEKRIHLLKLVAQLRDHVDIHRIIGLNIEALREARISSALLGYLQKSAHESLAIYICKIFESSIGNDLNSIPGVIESIPAVPVSDMQCRQLAVFGKKYGLEDPPTDARSYLRKTLGVFRAAHAESLGQLKEFRDTTGAHSDYDASITSLPSHAEFEILFSFARDFYEVVSRAINESGPAVIPRTVAHGFITLMKSVGVQAVSFDFEEEK